MFLTKFPNMFLLLFLCVEIFKTQRHIVLLLFFIHMSIFSSKTYFGFWFVYIQCWLINNSCIWLRCHYFTDTCISERMNIQVFVMTELTVLRTRCMFFLQILLFLQIPFTESYFARIACGFPFIWDIIALIVWRTCHDQLHPWKTTQRQNGNEFWIVSRVVLEL